MSHVLRRGLSPWLCKNTGLARTPGLGLATALVLLSQTGRGQGRYPGHVRAVPALPKEPAPRPGSVSGLWLRDNHGRGFRQCSESPGTIQNPGRMLTARGAIYLQNLRRSICAWPHSRFGWSLPPCTDQPRPVGSHHRSIRACLLPRVRL